MFANGVISADAAHHLWRDGFNIAWLGALLGSLSVLLFFLCIQLAPIARNQRYSNPVITALLIAGACAIFGNMTTLNHSGTLSLLYIIMIFAGWLLYEFWYVTLPAIKTPLLNVGNVLPSFSLQDVRGIDYNSASLGYGHYTLWIFYRGNSCPFCTKLLQQLAVRQEDFIEQGIELVFISSQAAIFTQGIAKQFQFPTTFLIDHENKLAQTLGINLPHALPLGMAFLGFGTETIIPTSILTDASLNIIHVDISDHSRLRSEINEILELIPQRSV